MTNERKKDIKLRLNPWRILTIITLVLVIVNLYFTYNLMTSVDSESKNIGTGAQQPSQPTQPQPTQPQEPSRIQVSVDDDAQTGPSNAKVTIVEFSDFECPFCDRIQPTVKQILETYGDDVRLIYRDFPLGFHPNAQKAAEAAECADDQGKFWEMHDKMFENQQAIDIASLKQYAKDLGLDSETFDSCLDSDKYASEVQKDFQDGQAYGVSGTPTFFINGIKVVGAQPFSAFQQVIDNELAN